MGSPPHQVSVLSLTPTPPIQIGKDQINEETIEFMCPYIELENFTPEVAKKASSAAEGLCTWVRAMKYYHEASKIVKPKLEKLAIAEAQVKLASPSFTFQSPNIPTILSTTRWKQPTRPWQQQRPA